MSSGQQAAAPAAQHSLELQRDYSGGLNNRDAPTELADNDLYDAMNITLDERGGATKRLGLQQLGSTLSGVAQALFDWDTESLLIVQIADTVYKTTNWSSLTSIKTFSDSRRAGFCEFHGKLMMVHPADGVFSYTAGGGVSQTSGGTNNMEFAKGDCIVAWQNILLVAGDKRADYRTFVWACAPGDETTWDVGASGTWVAVRTIDDAPVVALEVGQGQDVLGRPGLIVCKERSTYRIHAVDTLAYTVMHNEAGAAGSLAIFNLRGVTAMLNESGIWVTDGTAEPKLASGKIEKMFREQALAYGALSGVCAGAYQDRLVFSIPRIVSGQATPTANNLTLEMHPRDGWIVPHNFGAAAFAVYKHDSSKLYGVHSTAAKAFDTFVGGADLGTDISARLQTKWYEPAKGQKCRFRRARLDVRGTFDFTAKLDYNLGITDPTAINVGAGGNFGVWGSGTWGQPWQWGSGRFETTVDLYSHGVGRFISFLFEETSQKTAYSKKLLTDGARFPVGVFGVYGSALDFVPLGLA